MIPMVSSFSARSCRVVAKVTASLIVLALCTCLAAQEKVVWSEQERPIAEQIKGLRKLDDATRAQTTKELALRIRQLPAVPNKLHLAGALAELSTEGDFGCASSLPRENPVNPIFCIPNSLR